MKRFLAVLSLAIAMTAMPRSASAGFIVIDGTDANDHGFASGGVNQQGWLYMQRVLETLGAQRLAANPGAPKTVYNIGGDVGSDSGNAITSAFNLSNLASNGWTLVNVTGATAINNTLSTASAGAIGILAITTGGGNAGGDLDPGEESAVNSSGTAINNYLAAGGALHAMSASYGWISSLLPGFQVVSTSSSGISLTPAGAAAFPGLTNGDLSSGPWHNYFGGNFGALSVLGTSPFGGVDRPLILGGSTAGGNITNPGVSAPLPPTALVALALPVLGLVRRRRLAA